LDYESLLDILYSLLCLDIILFSIGIKHFNGLIPIADLLGLFIFSLLFWLQFKLKEREDEIRWLMAITFVVGSSFSWMATAL